MSLGEKVSLFLIFVLLSSNAASQSYVFHPVSIENIENILDYHIYVVRFIAPDDKEFYHDYVTDFGDSEGIGDISKVSGGVDTIPPIRLTELEKKPVYLNGNIHDIDQAIMALTGSDITIWDNSSTRLNIDIGWQAPTIVMPKKAKELSELLKRIEIESLDPLKLENWIIEDLVNLKNMIAECSENDHGFIYILE